MHSTSRWIESKISATALIMMLILLWLLIRGYHGLTGDAQIYAFQALARLHSYFANDLFLQNTSQDRFTIFSPLYAWFISWLGLEPAAKLLTLTLTVWISAAGWSIARALTSRDLAWLAAAFVLILPGEYGGSSVFEYSERYLTARLLAEALVLTALACRLNGKPSVALLLAVGALAIHPIMALPGVLLLLCMSLTIHAATFFAIAGLVLATGVSIIAARIPAVGGPIVVMDPAWLEVVHERSQFLFLQLWSLRDWNTNIRPFLYLGLTSLVSSDPRVQDLCRRLALIGVTGLALAFVAGLSTPVALLVQSQTWRWVWVAAFVATLLLPTTILTIWRDPTCGRLCALCLLVSGTLPEIDGTACVAFAMFLWLIRTKLTERAGRYCRRFAVIAGVALIVFITFRNLPLSHPPLSAAPLSDFFGLRIVCAVCALMAYHWIGSHRGVWASGTLCMVFAALSWLALPYAFSQRQLFAAVPDTREFSSWIDAIPEDATVLVVPPQDVGGFVWFTLGRLNYLALDQSAGVVFSRATAAEVWRRSDVLRPLMEPNWRIRTALQLSAKNKEPIRADTMVTSNRLAQICSDPTLGYVISRAEVGFDPLPHVGLGPWQRWNLYDCRRVRTSI